MKGLLVGKNILITGATGLIGRSLIKYIHDIEPSCHILALVHSLDKARKFFPNDTDWLTLIEADVNESINIDEDIDCIIHGASITSSKAFVDMPIETIGISVKGTCNLLELACQKQVKSFVYLSTMEVYGVPTTEDKITEDHANNLDTMRVRSSYPEGKRLGEALCTAYYSERGVPAKVIRLTQTIGPYVDYNDGRVFAEFARCAVEKKDIVLHTKGETKRMYISTDDAANAILTVLLKGVNGEAYNAANEDTYCSIFDMAHLVTDEICNGEIKVVIKEEDISKFGYEPVLKMNLDTRKLQQLGWSPVGPLKKMFEELIIDLKRQYELMKVGETRN